MRALIAAAALLTAGCALLEPQTEAVDRIVADALAAARTPVAKQKAALSAAQADFERHGGVPERLRLATLLAVLPTPLRDDARALELLEPVVNPASAGYGRFAALLSAQLMERQRLARELERMARESERTARERDKREEALREQLEAMQSIERGILERQEKLRRQR